MTGTLSKPPSNKRTSPRFFGLKYVMAVFAPGLALAPEARRIAAKPLKARKYAAGTGNGQALAYVKFQRHS